jgi:hypothetical protein
MESEVKEEDRIWVPYDELKTYLKTIQTTLESIVLSVDHSINSIEENAVKNKGDSKDE